MTGIVVCTPSCLNCDSVVVFSMFAKAGKAKGDDIKAAFPEFIRSMFPFLSLGLFLCFDEELMSGAGRELAQALYEFKGQDGKELSFSPGDVLVILNKKHEIWWWAQHRESCMCCHLFLWIHM